MKRKKHKYRNDEVHNNTTLWDLKQKAILFNRSSKGHPLLFRNSFCNFTIQQTFNSHWHFIQAKGRYINTETVKSITTQQLGSETKICIIQPILKRTSFTKCLYGTKHDPHLCLSILLT